MMKTSVVLLALVLVLALTSQALAYEMVQLNFYDARFYTEQGSTLDQGTHKLCLAGNGEPYQTMLKWGLVLEGRGLYGFSWSVNSGSLKGSSFLFKIKDDQGNTLVAKNVVFPEDGSDPTVFFWSYSAWQGMHANLDIMMGHLEGCLVYTGNGSLFRWGHPTETGSFLESVNIDLSKAVFFTETGAQWDPASGTLDVFSVNEHRWGTMLTTAESFYLLPGYRVRVHILGRGCGYEAAPSGDIVFKLTSGSASLGEKTQSLSDWDNPQEIVFDILSTGEGVANLQLLLGWTARATYEIDSLWLEVFDR